VFRGEEGDALRKVIVTINKRSILNPPPRISFVENTFILVVVFWMAGSIAEIVKIGIKTNILHLFTGCSFGVKEAAYTNKIIIPLEKVKIRT